jgi:hypothetical protein
MTTEVVVVQPLASVAVTLYVPAIKPLAVAVFWPLFHRYVIAPVPPVPAAVADPFAPPKQDTLVLVLIVTDTAVAGCVITAVAVLVQLFASVTVTVYVPAARPVAV